MRTIELYTSTCISCGKDKLEIARLQSYCNKNDLRLVIHNSKYNGLLREKHAGYVSSLGLDEHGYPSIVVSENSTQSLKTVNWEAL